MDPPVRMVARRRSPRAWTALRSLLLAVLCAALIAGATTGCANDPGDAADGAAVGSETAAGRLLVATAASLKAAFTDIGAAFDQATGSDTTFTFDASGTLQKQIETGAPVDVFVSASPIQVDNLLEQSLVDRDSVTAFAGNSMVLVVPADSTLGIAGFQDLAKPEVQKITTSDPKSSPQGMAAMEVLTFLDLVQAVEPKMIYGKNASQTLTYVVQGEVDAGIMFSTDAVSSGDAVRVVEKADATAHGAISYVMALVDTSQAKDLGRAFLEFTAGPGGRAILAEHGFLLP